MVVRSNTGRNIIHRRFVNSQEPLLERILCENDVGLVLNILGQPSSSCRVLIGGNLLL